ncbi:DUF2589 domain-containing protein [Ferrovibrio sp.]|uniref:DUF2589 domain-containing protein n=1 Tax=Ferrovibrio sp. TaxID=1917215 RepID=UPI003120018C
MLSQGKELAALDFAQIIGGPLEAVITAQAQAANVTTQFIQATAFEPSSGGAATGPQKLKVVAFDYGQMMGSVAGGPSGDALVIKVPLLTMLPIPFIRVDSMTIDLNVSLHSTHTTKESNEATTTGSASGEYFGTTFNCSVTDKNTYQNDMVIDDTYSLHVTVHAVQDQMPGGMQNVLNIFSSVIQQQSSLIQQVMSASIAAQTKALAAQSGGAGGGGTPAN